MKVKKGSQYYYSILNVGEQNLYQQIYHALLNFEPALSIHAGMGKPFEIDIKKIIEAVLFDHPIFFYFDKTKLITKETPFYIQICFRYLYTKQETIEKWNQIESKINDFLLSIHTDIKPLAKQLKIHRYLCQIQSSSKPYQPTDFTIEGAFLNNQCVCEGFAKAYKLLCDYVNIASIVVCGEASVNGISEPHAWNITRIDGVTSHIDIAWDSKINDAPYDYFNLSDADITIDHHFDQSLYPMCSINQINYFHLNKMVAFDENQLKQIIAKMDRDEYAIKLLFNFDIKKINTLGFKQGQIRWNEPQHIIGFKQND